MSNPISSKTDSCLSGESSSQSQPKEYQFFLESIDCTPETSKTTNTPYPPESASTPSPSVQPEPEPQPIDSTSPNIIVYHRKRGKQKESKTSTDLQLLPASEIEVNIPTSDLQIVEKNFAGSSSSNLGNSDENLPIALRKGVR
ncbi:unnamed protein product [Dovyalis caffra]|uniref:Uncharacterized protein n=1 Tax=Dovyalis caffra TaxID=77055 RepID=A0AAV1RPP9_9ROSI|nr:unnamed protein product [Dovyalis caffra]